MGFLGTIPISAILQFLEAEEGRTRPPRAGDFSRYFGKAAIFVIAILVAGFSDIDLMDFTFPTSTNSSAKPHSRVRDAISEEPLAF
jgi:hypothetical protein